MKGVFSSSRPISSMTVNKVEHSCCDDSNLQLSRHPSMHLWSTRESPQRWFLSVQTSLIFKLRFFIHVFHPCKHWHFAPQQTRNAAFFW